MTSAAARARLDAACARRLISAMVALAWVWVCSEMSRRAWASASQISCWRLAVAAPVCCHSSRSAAAMPASDPVQASRRAPVAGDQVALQGDGGLGASAAASTRRLISASVSLAWARD